jgi:hypothetical protein
MSTDNLRAFEELTMIHRPLPMYASGYIFSRSFFIAWIVVAVVWVWGTMLVAGFFPIIDGAGQLKQVYLGLTKGLKVKEADRASDTVVETAETIFQSGEK